MHKFSRNVYACVAGLALLAAPGAFAAVECNRCEPRIRELRDLQEQKRKTADLLGKNQDYLSGLTAEQASKFLKVKSNIAQILYRIEKFNKEIDTAEKRMSEEGCASCVQGKGDTP